MFANTNEKIPHKILGEVMKISASNIKPFSSYAQNTTWGAQSALPPRQDRVKFDENIVENKNVQNTNRTRKFKMGHL